MLPPHIDAMLDEILDTVGPPRNHSEAHAKATTLVHALIVVLSTMSDFDDDRELDRFATKLAANIREHVANGRRQWHKLEGHKPS